MPHINTYMGADDVTMIISSLYSLKHMLRLREAFVDSSASVRQHALRIKTLNKGNIYNMSVIK